MKLTAVSALFLPFILAYSGLFDGVDPSCVPCLNEVVADGPSNTQSKEFANYLCIGLGASAVGLCITECMGPEIYIIEGVMLDYCVQYYPEETCANIEDTEFSQLPPCSKIRKGGGNGGNESTGSDSEDSTTEATETTGSGPQPTDSSDSGSRGSGKSHTSAGGMPATMGAFASWEMLTGLVMLAVHT